MKRKLNRQINPAETIQKLQDLEMEKMHEVEEIRC